MKLYLKTTTVALAETCVFLVQKYGGHPKSRAKLSGLVHKTEFLGKNQQETCWEIFFAEETGHVYIFVEETVKKLDKPKREQVLYFLDGENWFVEFLDSFTRNSTRKTMCFACRVPRSCVRGFRAGILKLRPSSCCRTFTDMTRHDGNCSS